MDLNTILADPRRRNLAVLGAIALVSLLLAILVVWQQAREGAAGSAHGQFLRGFAKEVRNAAHIHIVSKAGAFDVVFVPEKGWVVPERANYPASFDLVQRTLVGLAALQTIEAKTARPDWFHFVGLDMPPKGDGVLIAVGDDKGRELAAVIAGKGEDIGDPTGATGLFVRRPGEDQSWLARSVLDPRGSLTDWLDKRVMDVDRSRIQDVDVEPAGGGATFTVSRANPGDPDFKLTPVPAGKSVSDPTVPDGVAAAITGFGFDDVRPAHEIDFSNAAATARVTTRTFDGLKIAVSVQKIGDDYWATVSAEASDPTKPDTAKEAAAIDAHASGWAYKLPSFKGQLFMTTLDSLLKAPAAPPAAPPQP
ncbi:MAG: DUF4340 domain-containing protein [Rhizomicrobium sp.]